MAAANRENQKVMKNLLTSKHNLFKTGHVIPVKFLNKYFYLNLI